MSEKADKMRDEFARQRSMYEEFARCVDQLLQILLREQGIVIHSISHRVKDLHSLHEKIDRPGKNYACISDITDLVGIRIITYLPESVDPIGQMVESQFSIDRLNSIDKRLAADPDRFGYASLHKVCSLNEQRVKLSEYARFAGLKCEIQIRTILQHAWAEIEHDLDYKSLSGLPPERPKNSGSGG